MLVQDIMERQVVTINPRTALPEALRLLQQRRIRHLPVLENGELVGIISDRDLKRAMASPATSLTVHELQYLLDRLRIGEIMTRGVITIGPMMPVEAAARLMVQEKISALPVTEGARLVGIVTETDLLQLLVEAMGAAEPSSRLDVLLGDRPSALVEVVRAVEDAGLRISSIVTFPARGGMKTAVVRLATIDPGPAVRALEARGYAVRETWRSP